MGQGRGAGQPDGSVRQREEGLVDALHGGVDALDRQYPPGGRRGDRELAATASIELIGQQVEHRAEPALQVHRAVLGPMLPLIDAHHHGVTRERAIVAAGASGCVDHHQRAARTDPAVPELGQRGLRVCGPPQGGHGWLGQRVRWITARARPIGDQHDGHRRVEQLPHDGLDLGCCGKPLTDQHDRLEAAREPIRRHGLRWGGGIAHGSPIRPEGVTPGVRQARRGPDLAPAFSPACGGSSCPAGRATGIGQRALTRNSAAWAK
jgi:hypothetical protein